MTKPKCESPSGQGTGSLESTQTDSVNFTESLAATHHSVLKLTTFMRQLSPEAFGTTVALIAHDYPEIESALRLSYCVGIADGVAGAGTDHLAKLTAGHLVRTFGQHCDLCMQLLETRKGWTS